MAGFLTKLGRGAGQALTAMGEGFLDQQKQDRLEKMKKEEWAFRSAEGDKDRDAQLKAAEMRSGNKGKPPRTQKIETYDDGTSLVSRQDPDGNFRDYIFNPADNSFTLAGKGVKGSETDTETDLWDEGAEWADAKAGWLPWQTDAKDFEIFDPEDRSEDRVARIYADVMQRARKIGQEDKWREHFSGEKGLENLKSYWDSHKKKYGVNEPTQRPKTESTTKVDETTTVTPPEKKTPAGKTPSGPKQEYTSADDIGTTMSKLFQNAKLRTKETADENSRMQEQKMEEWKRLSKNMTDAEKKLWIQENIRYIKNEKLRKQILG